MERIARRRLLGSAGLLAGTGLVAGYAGQLLGRSAETPKQDRPWQYLRLAPEDVADRAYRLFPEGACMYGVFSSVITALGDRAGEPYSSFPLHMMRYGEGGVSGWGSLCGTLNAGAALIGLFQPVKEAREKLVNELYQWYETTELPVYQPKGEAEPIDIPRSKAAAVLCHVSVDHWGKESGYDVPGQEMAERCRRLTADVAAETVRLLNSMAEGVLPEGLLSEQVKSCTACHGPKELLDSIGKMECGACHKLPEEHP